MEAPEFISDSKIISGTSTVYPYDIIIDILETHFLAIKIYHRVNAQFNEMCSLDQLAMEELKITSRLPYQRSRSDGTSSTSAGTWW